MHFLSSNTKTVKSKKRQFVPTQKLIYGTMYYSLSSGLWQFGTSPRLSGMSVWETRSWGGLSPSWGGVPPPQEGSFHFASWLQEKEPKLHFKATMMSMILWCLDEGSSFHVSSLELSINFSMHKATNYRYFYIGYLWLCLVLWQHPVPRPG